ncbi:MAG: DUF3352 domain-containing protein [Oscillatoriales cyanobacterium]|nr:MAG: DUF3352 domain-containing protein [Oscillatoriales cyanobacterium]
MTETSSPKKSNFGCVFPAIGAAVLIGGGAAAYWTLNRTSSAEMTAEANAAVLPDETIAIAHLNTATFAELAQFGTPAAQAEVQQRLATLLSGLSPGLDWERDLKPWVGSVTLGLATPIATEPEGGPDLHAYFAIAIRDKLQAIKFASGLKSEAGNTAIESEYAGVKVIQVNPDQTGRGATLATMGDHVILAGSLDNLKNAIDDIQAKTTASRNAELQQTLSQSASVDRPLLQIYIPNTAAFPLPNTAPNAAKAGEPQTPPASPPPIRASVATINVTDTGLHGSINVMLNGDRELPTLVPISDRPETQFPEQTLLLIAGTNLAQTWTQFVARAEGDAAIPQTQQALAVLRSGFTSLGLDADRDVFPWMDGEAAIGAFPITSGLLKQFGLAAAVTAETSDRAAASQALGKLSEAIKRRIPVPLTEVDRKTGAIEIKEWTVPVPGVGSGGLFGYGWRDDRNVIVGLSAPAIDAIAQPAATNLASNPDFQDVMQDLPTEKTGYAYFNLAQLYQQLQTIPVGAGQILSPQTTTLLGATRSLGATVASDAPDQITLNLSLALQPFTASETPPATPEAAPNSETTPNPDTTPTPAAE